MVLIAVLAVLAGAGTVAVAALRLGDDSTPTAGGSGSPTPGDSASPTPSLPVACATATLAKLTVAQRAGQVLMIGTPVGDPTSIAATVRQYQLGAVFLAGRSKQPAATLLAATKTLQQAAADSSGIPLQIAVDQEGGQVQTLSGPDFPTIPSALVQGTWSTSQLHDRTVEWAKRLRAAGLTMDLAPVADTVPAGTGDANPPIGAFDRQFGSDPAKVAGSVTTVVGAVQEAGILATVKHFPGLGRVRANTDTSTNAVDSTTTAEDAYLQPFQAAIGADTTAVMISSAKYPKLDSANIAAYSPAIITGLLRQKLGFTGLVLSDDLGAAVAAKSLPVGDRAVRFLTAGGDVVLTVRTADAAPMSAALVTAAGKDPQFAARLADAAGHVLAAKARAGLLTC